MTTKQTREPLEATASRRQARRTRRERSGAASQREAQKLASGGGRRLDFGWFDGGGLLLAATPGASTSRDAASPIEPDKLACLSRPSAGRIQRAQDK